MNGKCLATATGAAMVVAWTAHGGILLTVAAGSASTATLAPGDTLTLTVSVSGDPAEVHTSAIFRTVFSASGFTLLGYAWSSPYVTGGTFDDSTPAASALPLFLTDSLVEGPGFPSGMIDVEFSNVTGDASAPPPAFSTGTLLTMDLRFDGPPLPAEILVSLAPDTFANGFDPLDVTVGDPFRAVIVPAPAVATLVLAGGLAARRRPSRRRD